LSLRLKAGMARALVICGAALAAKKGSWILHRLPRQEQTAAT
jgi:hypothetical protein